MTSQEYKKQLEDLIDHSSVSKVLETLSEICWEKSQHIQTVWQDKILSQIWERAGNQLSGFYAKFSDRYNI